MATRLKTATRKSAKDAAINSMVDSIGGTSEADVEFVDEGDVLSWAAGKFIERVHKNLEEADSATTSSSSRLSIGKVTDTTLEINVPQHLIYIDKGVNGSKVKLYDTPFSYKTKRPPVEPILEWIKKKNLVTGTTDGKGKAFKNKEDEYESMAYAIREKIFQEGQAPKNVYSKEIPQLAEDIAKHYVGFSIKNIIENINNK